ncbi:MAG: TRAP transporter TatT component family protein [Syntrophobacterales bacterium]|nr:TRAP transporter TatT component family protein [Syntrophobacterales bacterium]
MLICLALACGGSRPLTAPGPETDSSAALARWQEELTQAELRLSAAGPDRPQVLARLARTAFLLAEHLPPPARDVYLEKGRHYAELLLTEQPERVEGYYWSSLNLCGTAKTCGAGRALRMLPEIEARLQRAATLNPAYDQAGPHRVLGRLYSEAPPWPISVGDLSKSLDHLRQAVRLAPKTSTNQLFLAETCLKLGRKAEALQALTQVLSATDHPVWPQGLTEDRRKAEILLKEAQSPGATAQIPLR